MRRAKCSVLMALVVLVMCGTAAHAYPEVKLVFEGQPMDLTPPGWYVDQSVFFPAVPYLQVMGAQVIWDQPRQAIIAEKDGLRLVMVIGERETLVGNGVVANPSPPRLIEGVPYVTMRFPAGYLGYEVKWDRAAMTASLTAKAPAPPPGQLALLAPTPVPELLWVGEGDYADGGVSPKGGSHANDYHFQVLYRHPDNRYPESLKLYLRPQPANGDQGTAWDLAELRRLGDNYTHGVVYGITVPATRFKPGVTYDYWFVCSDGQVTLIR